jgi:hypothetical protein
MVNFFSKSVSFSLRNGEKHIIFVLKQTLLFLQLRQISLEIIVSLEIIDGFVDLLMQKKVFISSSNAELIITILD